MKFTILTLLILCTSLYSREWYRLEGTYSVVEFQSGNEAIADSILEISESVLPRLQQIFNLSDQHMFDEPVRIILTDALDISNGFALDNTVVIYTLSSAYLPLWTGRQKWYEQVLSHELAHTMTFRKIKRTANFLGNISYLAAPRWYYEGLAQYYAEEWTAFRGDLYLKNALFDGNLNINSLNNIQDSRLLYATGHAFVRYLADQYGDSSLVQLMSYDSTSFFYDFSSGFNQTFGEPLDNVFKRFIRHMVIYYGNSYSAYKEHQFFKSLPRFGSDIYQIRALQSADSIFLVSSKEHPFDLFRSASIVRLKNGRFERISKLFENYHTTLVMSSDERYICYGRYRNTISSNIMGLSFDWFVFDRQTQESRRILEKTRARFAAFRGERLVLSDMANDGSILYEIDLKTSQKRKILNSHFSIGRLVTLHDHQIILEAQRSNGFRDLFILKGDTLFELTNDDVDDRLPIVTDSTQFVFTRLVNRKANLYRFNLSEMTIHPLLSDIDDFWSHSYNAKTRQIIVYHWEPGRQSVFSTIHIDSLKSARKQSEEEIPINRFGTWVKKRPYPDLLSISDTTIKPLNRESISTPYFPMEHGLSVALPVYDSDFGFGIYGITSWFEILQRQALGSTFIVFPGELKRSLGLLTHFIRIFNFGVTSIYYHGPVVFSNRNDSHIDMIRDMAAVNIGRVFHIAGNSRWQIKPALSAVWNRYLSQEKDPDVEDETNFTAVRVGLGIEYALNTRFYPFLPKRQIGLYGYLHLSLDQFDDFQIWEGGFFAGSKILFETISLKTHLSYMTQSGRRPSIFGVGIDRFYETNLARDIGYTRAVRGVREDIYGDRFFWTSTELVFFLARSSGLKMLFLPIENMALTGFLDYAEISGEGRSYIAGYGAELTFGEKDIRFGFGFALGRGSNSKRQEQWYWRLSLSFPQPTLN